MIAVLDFSFFGVQKLDRTSTLVLVDLPRGSQDKFYSTAYLGLPRNYSEENEYFDLKKSSS